MDSVFADTGENLKSIAAGQHDIENDDVELFGVDAEECVLTGLRQDRLVAFVLDRGLRAILARLMPWSH